MKYVIWFLVVVLIVLHHDFWNWDNDQVLFGFVPIGLFYHICLSVAAGVVWFLATKLMWPQELNELDEQIAMEAEHAAGDSPSTAHPSKSTTGAAS